MPRHYDDDDDDRPRRRRPRDDDDDDRFRRRDRPPARSSNGAVIAIVVIAVAIVVAGVVGGGLFVFHRVQKKNEQFVAQIEADIAKEEARRKTELARAATEVKAAEAGGALQVTAARFAKAYDDGDRADRQYKNKVLEVTGPLDEVDFTGDTYTVLLKAGPDDTVNCEFAKSPEVRARLARLKPGDTVRIRGKCLGGGPSLEACVLVE